MNYEYILALWILCVLFGVGIYLMKYIRNYKLFNIIFPMLVFILYICMCVYIYFTDTDLARRNFLNTLPVANVSLFMFSLMPILIILPIYNFVLVSNSYLSALIYYIGLGCVLLMGFAACKFFNSRNMDISNKSY